MKQLTIREAADFLLRNDNYVLLTHRRPDGDTIGVYTTPESGSITIPMMKRTGYKGEFAGAVEAEDADLGAREEREGNVLKNLTLRRDDLPDAVHRKNILGHGLMTTPDMTKAVGERRIRPNATCMS